MNHTSDSVIAGMPSPPRDARRVQAGAGEPMMMASRSDVGVAHTNEPSESSDSSFSVHRLLGFADSGGSDPPARSTNTTAPNSGFATSDTLDSESHAYDGDGGRVGARPSGEEGSVSSSSRQQPYRQAQGHHQESLNWQYHAQASVGAQQVGPHCELPPHWHHSGGHDNARATDQDFSCGPGVSPAAHEEVPAP